MPSEGIVRKLAAPAYLVAALLVVVPVLDFVTNVWPLHPGQAVWRYGSVGLFSGFILNPLLGVLVAVVTAAAAEHGGALRVMGWFSMAIAVLCVLATGAFVLDALQVRADVPPEGRTQFETGIWRAVVKYFVVAVALAWLGLAARRAGRYTRRGIGG